MLTIIIVVVTLLILLFAGFCVLYALDLISPDGADETEFILVFMKKFGAAVGTVTILSSLLGMLSLFIYLLYTLLSEVL
jgi:hypothetical protein